RRDELGVADGGHGHEKNAVRKFLDDVGPELETQSSLADASWPGQREKPRAAEEAPGLGHVVVAADEARELGRQVVGGRIERAQGRKLVWHACDHELVEAFRTCEVLQAVRAEVAQRKALGEMVLDQCTRRLRDYDLTPMSRRSDTRGVVDVEADVLVADQR